MRIEKRPTCIQSVKQWEDFAGPKQKKQWKPGRSAMETARAWMPGNKPSMPPGIRAILDSCDQTADLRVDVVHPECQIRFDKFRGEPRNADIAFSGKKGDVTVAVTVECKADEKFGETLHKQYGKAEKAKKQNPASRAVDRIENLCKGLFGIETDLLDEVASLRYQLLTATAGTLAYANEEGASVAVLLVHVFKTHATSDDKLLRNDTDYTEFLRRLHKTDPEAGKSGDLEGPFHLPGNDLYKDPVPLYVGKVVTVVE